MRFREIKYLVGSVLELLQEVVGDVGAVIDVDEAEGVETAALRVAGRGGGYVARQVGRHQRQRLLLVAAVDHTERRRRCQLRPIRGSRKPGNAFKMDSELVVATSRKTVDKFSIPTTYIV